MDESSPQRVRTLHSAFLGRRALGLGALAGFALHAACANIRPLEGGAADVTPPSLLTVVPRDSSTSLGPTPVLRFDFDEPVHAASIRSGMRLYPSTPVPDVRVNGQHVELRYQDSLPADTTLTLVLGKSVQDSQGRDNKLVGEIWLVFATGPALHGGAVFGRVSVKGKPEPTGAVRYEPIVPTDTSAAADSTRRSPRGGPRPRLPVAGCDKEGLFQLLALPAERPFVLTAFVDRNGSLEADDGELSAAYPETLRLAEAEVRRGIEWNLVDPNEPGHVQGVAFNRSGVEGPLAIALQAVDVRMDSVTAGADSLQGTRSTRVAPGAASDSLPAVADSLPPRRGSVDKEPSTRAEALLRLLPEAPQGPWEAAYSALDAKAPTRAAWRVVYVSPRGDYSIRVPPGRHRLLAFVDAGRDSMPGTFVAPDSTRLEWEPLWVGGILEVAPAGEVRPRSIDIEAPP